MINGVVRPFSSILRTGHRITIDESVFSEAMVFRETLPDPVIVYEDDYVIVIDKPVGFLVHADGATEKPDVVSMMAKLLALMDGCDSAALHAKMAQIFSLFESSCCAPGQAAAAEGRPATHSTPMNSSACDCSAGSFNCMPNRKENQK